MKDLFGRAILSILTILFVSTVSNVNAGEVVEVLKGKGSVDYERNIVNKKAQVDNIKAENKATNTTSTGSVYAIATYKDSDSDEEYQYDDIGYWYLEGESSAFGIRVLDDWGIDSNGGHWDCPSVGFDYFKHPEELHFKFRAWNGRVFSGSSASFFCITLGEKRLCPHYNELENPDACMTFAKTSNPISYVSIPSPFTAKIYDSNNNPISGVKIALAEANGMQYSDDEEYKGISDENGLARLIVDEKFNNTDRRIMIDYGGCHHYTTAINVFQNKIVECIMPPKSKFVLINALGEKVPNVPVYVIGAKDNLVYSDQDNPPVTDANGEVEFCVASKLCDPSTGWKFAYGYAGQGYITNETFTGAVKFTQTVVAINRPEIYPIGIVSGQPDTLRFSWENLSNKGVAKYLVRLKSSSASGWTNLGVTSNTAVNISGFTNPGQFIFQIYGYNSNNQLLTYSRQYVFSINASANSRSVNKACIGDLSSEYTSKELSSNIPELIIDSIKKIEDATDFDVKDLEKDSESINLYSEEIMNK